MLKHPDLNQLSTEQLRALAAEIMTSLSFKDRAIVHRDAVIEKLSHQVAILKPHKYAQRSEQMNVLQGSLLDELAESDLPAIEAELAQRTVIDAPAQPKKLPIRTPFSMCQPSCRLNISEDYHGPLFTKAFLKKAGTTTR